MIPAPTGKGQLPTWNLGIGAKQHDREIDEPEAQAPIQRTLRSSSTNHRRIVHPARIGWNRLETRDRRLSNHSVYFKMRLTTP